MEKVEMEVNTILSDERLLLFFDGEQIIDIV